MWAFCVYLESVSVFPQLRMMQKAKVRAFKCHGFDGSKPSCKGRGAANELVIAFVARGGQLEHCIHTLA